MRKSQKLVEKHESTSDDFAKLEAIKRKLEMAIELFPKSLARSGIFRQLIPEAIKEMNSILRNQIQ